MTASEQPRRGDWMQTYTGVQFWPLDPRPEEIRILDIAHALSNQCRFAGHCTKFYSVAQHSVIVSSWLLPRHLALWGLLHDASEAYLVDLPRPVKRANGQIGETYRQIEADLMRVICQRFDMPTEEPRKVKAMDDRVLMAEKRDLMPNCPHKWRETATPIPHKIEPWSAEFAEAEFLSVWESLQP